MTPIYVSYYTLATGYESEARELMQTLETFNLPCDVVGIHSHGSWQANTQAKAGFIRSMLNKHPGRPLVWLDADARVRERPVLFDTLDCDFAAHWREDTQWPFGELISAACYFSGSKASVDLVDEWIDECNRSPAVWDQLCLDWARGNVPGLRAVRLPPQYCLIFDMMAHLGPPVIEQMQASRRLKNTIQ